MTIRAQIVADSVNPTGNRLTTWLLYYPRCIHSEVLTHRAFSRNSASSRAIPIKTMIERIRNDPFVPKWGRAQKGMSVSEFFDDASEVSRLTQGWFYSMETAMDIAKDMDEMGVAKGNVNRILEPWMHIEVVLSATEFKNFFALRDHPAAEPSLRELAALMKDVYTNSDPVLRQSPPPVSPCTRKSTLVYTDDCWHLPFLPTSRVLPQLAVGPTLLNLVKESIAHAAWVSYGNAAGKEGFTQEDVDRVYNTLLESQPLHASPAEHVAVACDGPHRHGNFTGWCQWRKFLPGEAGGDYEGLQ